MITLRNVTKAYHTRTGSHQVLNGVSFSIHRGQSLGILGRNGAGKSTLMRLISGVEHPTSGSVERRMTTSWPLGYSGAVQASLSGADNVRYIARIYGRPIQETLDFVEDFAELGDYFRMPVRTYSAGMHARLTFGASLAVDFDCYIIDEIAGAGDHRFAERCQRALLERRERGSLIMISHDTHALQTYCEMGAVLHTGNLTTYDNLSDAIEVYRAL